MHVLLSTKDLYPASSKTEREWKSIVSNFRGHPALLGWYMNDENGGQSPSAKVIDMYTKRNRAILALDPDHVTVSVVNRWICSKCHASGQWPADHYIRVYENTSLVIGVSNIHSLDDAIVVHEFLCCATHIQLIAASCL